MAPTYLSQAYNAFTNDLAPTINDRANAFTEDLANALTKANAFTNSMAGAFNDAFNELPTRGLGASEPLHPPYDPHKRFDLQVIALSFSTISVASSILAFYWFLKMRRTFRHDLIMLLIQSDMFKALWFMLYPVVSFATGPVSSKSTFCQVNGFFISMSIEASDVAVALIALHSALCIFQPRSSVDGAGLYPYRRIAYLVWLIVPIIMASLAFVNADLAYMEQGTYCYLPTRPFWFRLALSWIPRYLIFGSILIVYAAIYFYVRYKFDGFEKTSTAGASNQPRRRSLWDRSISTAGTDGGNPPLPRRKSVFMRHGRPSTPPLAEHGLLPEWIPGPESDRKNSASTSDTLKTPNSPTSVNTPDSGTFPFSSAAPRFPPTARQGDTYPSAYPYTPGHRRTSKVTIGAAYRRASTITINIPAIHSITPMTTDFPNSPLEPPSPLQPPSPSHPPTNLQDKRSSKASFRSFMHLQNPPENASPVLTGLEVVDSLGRNLCTSEMQSTRERIRKQLRFLFIYPLVYLGMWTIPFVNHCLQYIERYAEDGTPFPIACLAVICVCSQGAVDCWLFSSREQPWKHIPDSDKTFLGGLKFWKNWHASALPVNIFSGGVSRRGSGKSRGEMSIDARRAYIRRDEEMAARRANSESKRKSHWWDDHREETMPAVVEGEPSRMKYDEDEEMDPSSPRSPRS